MSKRKIIKSIFFKLGILLIPFFIFSISYIVLDPFKVLYHYSDYYSGNRIVLNRDYTSTEIFLENYPKHHFTDFIFGSSRSKAFSCSEWEKYIHRAAFHYDASSESLYGVYKKILFLDKGKVPISNCLLIVDEGLLSKVKDTDLHLFVKHPILSGRSSINFQLIFYKVFFQDFFCFKYLVYKFVNRQSKFLQGAVSSSYVDIKPVNNEVYFSSFEEEIKKDSLSFYKKMNNEFYKRPSKAVVAAPVIGAIQIKMLKEINDVFRKNHTRVKIVINPLYDQIKLSPQDLLKLKNIFGSNDIFDYSGVNSITEERSNFYEPSHYRHYVANKILKDIYVGH